MEVEPPVVDMKFKVSISVWKDNEQQSRDRALLLGRTRLVVHNVRSYSIPRMKSFNKRRGEDQYEGTEIQVTGGATSRDCDIKNSKTGPTRLSAEEERKVNRTDHITQGEPRALRLRKTRQTLEDYNAD
jgi:hypothetical protein